MHDTPENTDWCPPTPTPPPAQERKQDILCPDSAIAHIGMNPFRLTGLLRRILTAKFTDPKNIETPVLRQLIWKDDPSTGILIESVNRWDMALANKRPALLIKRNGYKNFRFTIGDRIGMDSKTNDQFATAWLGSHQVLCIGQTGAMAELLASEVQRELTQIAPAVLKAVNRGNSILDRMQVTGVEETAIVAEQTENFAVPVTIGFAYQETWSLNPRALPFTGTIFEIYV
jgi:hypothetical protein